MVPAGTGATLIGGSRFVHLLTPFTLNAGFQGSIVEDPNVTDGNYNTLGGTNAATVNRDGGLISFVGVGRVGDNGVGTYPARLDSGPANRYDAATFQFTGVATPEPGTLALLTGLGMAGSGIIVRRRARRR